MGHTVLATQSNLHDKNDRKKTFREHRCGAGQILSEGQVRIRLFTLECQGGSIFPTLICVNVTPFIVIESWLFFLTSRSFQCGTLIQFPLLDLRAFLGNRDFGSWALTTPVSEGPLRCVGPSLHRPNSFNPSGPLRSAHQIILSPSKK